MFYCVDQKNSLEKRRSVRAAHLQRLTTLKQENRLLLAGPLKNNNTDASHPEGSLIIADFDSLDEAKAWIAADPYVTAEVFQNIVMKIFEAAPL